MDHVVLTARVMPDLFQASGINFALRILVNEIRSAFTLILINVDLSVFGL